MFQKAAKAGNTRGQFWLGQLYEKGKGVARNDKLAASWYIKAAKRGNVSAQSKMGYLYATGIGVTKNAEESEKWYKIAGEHE